MKSNKFVNINFITVNKEIYISQREKQNIILKNAKSNFKNISGFTWSS